MELDPATHKKSPPSTEQRENERRKADIRQRAVELIMSEARRDPELCQRVVKKLEGMKLNGTSGTWSECEFYRSFRSWAKQTTGTERLKLEVFIATDAAHKSLSLNVENDYFTQVVRKRKLREWALEQLEPAKSGAEEPAKARPKPIKLEGTGERRTCNKAVAAKPAPPRAPPILPSIERITPRTQEPSPVRRLTLDAREASPFRSAQPTKRAITTTSESHEAGPALKVPKVTRDVPRPAAPTRDAAMQTESAMINRWARDLAGQLVDPFKTAFADVVAQQTKTLTELLPATVKTAVQQSLASEVAAHQQSHQQSHAAVMRPQVARPAAPEAALARQTYAAYIDPVAAQPQICNMPSYAYDDARQVVGRGGVRGLTSYVAAEGERLFDLGPYDFARGVERRRH